MFWLVGGVCEVTGRVVLHALDMVPECLFCFRTVCSRDTYIINMGDLGAVNRTRWEGGASAPTSYRLLRNGSITAASKHQCPTCQNCYRESQPEMNGLTEIIPLLYLL